MDKNQYQPYQPQPVEPYKKKKVPKRTKLALWLILGPTMLLIVAFLGYFIVNFFFGNAPQSTPESCIENADFSRSVTSNETCQNDLLGNPSPVKTAFNIVLFLAGGIGVLTWLPGLVVGIVLLATRPRA